ncbi:MAG: hypothetical protein A2161_09055 [Candidatus Schekmanbacteria bacterium RBG_13_48_7]|uniref:Cell division protein ZapB n=1 Tax=Candidatus Schekmanbacteria bacterium RBG_13_48_7 TaxID=1817878 RepID=A0A1F7RNP4_9BACT|nr:MAG: hypothetical protein A2161_09055 [Candidatus Schekmanbacteria bacterium RBG_13_48_7]
MSLDHLDVLEKKIVGVVALLVDLRNKQAELEATAKDLQQKLISKDREIQELQKNLESYKSKAQDSAEYEKERELIRTKVENMLKHLKKLEGAM